MLVFVRQGTLEYMAPELLKLAPMKQQWQLEHLRTYRGARYCAKVRHFTERCRRCIARSLRLSSERSSLCWATRTRQYILITHGVALPLVLQHISAQVDCWALGCLAFELLLGRSPFLAYPGASEDEVTQRLPQRCNRIRPLLTSLLSVDFIWEDFHFGHQEPSDRHHPRILFFASSYR